MLFVRFNYIVGSENFKIKKRNRTKQKHTCFNWFFFPAEFFKRFTCQNDNVEDDDKEGKLGDDKTRPYLRIAREYDDLKG